MDPRLRGDDDAGGWVPRGSCARRPPSPRPAPGFVLAITLWLLAGITVAVAMVTLWSLDEVRDATANRELLDERIAMLGTRDTIIYLAATRATTLAGLPVEPMDEDERAARSLEEFGGFDSSPRGGELHLDGTVYQGLGDIRFAIQDESGLFSLSWPAGRDVDRLLADLDVPRERIPQLRDALLDYIDIDDLRRLHGAEARQYEQQDLPPPPNRRLLLPAELTRIIGWRDLPEDKLRQLVELSTTTYAGALNLNAAPEALLPGLLDGCPQTCAIFAARRARQPFTSSNQVQTLLGTSLPGDTMVDYRFGPSEDLRITLWGESGSAWRIHVKLSPLADQHAPWYVSAAYPIPRRSRRPGPTSPRSPHAPAQPTDSALFADPAAAR